MATNLFCVRTVGFYVCKENLYEGLGRWRKFPFSAIDVRPNFAFPRLRAHSQKQAGNADVIGFERKGVTGARHS